MSVKVSRNKAATGSNKCERESSFGILDRIAYLGTGRHGRSISSIRNYCGLQDQKQHPSTILKDTSSHSVPKSSGTSIAGNERLERRQRIAVMESTRELIQPAL